MSHLINQPKNIAEIQRAHDILNEFVDMHREGKLHLVRKDELPPLTYMCDVLCWALGHDNPHFQDNLNQVLKLMEDAGYKLELKSEHKN